MISPQNNADNVPKTKKGPKGIVAPRIFLFFHAINNVPIIAPVKNAI